MVEAFKSAIAAGISPADFWDSTPYLAKQAIRSANEEQITRIWILASMTRMKKLPKLETLLNRNTTGQDAGMRLKAALIGISEKEKGK